MQSCWDGRVVGDDAITRCIARLRQLSNDEPGAFEIATLPRVGYRLVAHAREIAAEPVETRQVRFTWRGPKWPLAAFVAALALIGVLVGRNALRAPGAWHVDSIQPLLSTRFIEDIPAISPNGDLVAYSSNLNGGHPNIFLRKLSGGTPVQLTHEPRWEGGATWSPSGKELAYQSYNAGEPCRIMVVAISPPGAPRLLARCRSAAQWSLAYAVDGRSIFYSDRRNLTFPQQIMRLDLGDSSWHELTHPPSSSQGDVLVAASPDGAHIAFIRRASESRQSVMTLDLRSGMERTLWEGNDDHWNSVAWLDSQTIVAAWWRGADRALYAIPLRGPPSRLTTSTQLYYTVDRGPADLLAVSEPADVRALVSVGAANPSSAPLFVTREQLSEPIYADNGALACLSGEGGELGLWIAQPGGTPARVFSFGKNAAHSIAWSPDGHRLSMIRVVQDVAHLIIIDTSGRTQLDLALPAAAAGAQAWDRDGRGLLVEVGGRANPRLWHVDLASHALTSTPLTGWIAPKRDGDNVYAVRSTANEAQLEIWRILPTPLRIFDALWVQDANNWTVRGGMLWRLSRSDPDDDMIIEQKVEGSFVREWRADLLESGSTLTVDPKTDLPTYVDKLISDVNVVLMHVSKH